MRLALKDGLIKGARVSRRKPQISHLLFVGIDSYLERLLREGLIV